MTKVFKVLDTFSPEHPSRREMLDGGVVGVDRADPLARRSEHPWRVVRGEARPPASGRGSLQTLRDMLAARGARRPARPLQRNETP